MSKLEPGTYKCELIETKKTGNKKTPFRQVFKIADEKAGDNNGKVLTLNYSVK